MSRVILRRVITHFKKQEWTAIALDFLIVVVGVFIGIQFSNWNELRHERAIEHEYLERLYADMQQTLAAKPDRVTWNNDRKAQQAMVLHHLRTGVLPEEDRRAFEVGLAFFGFISGIDVDWATVEELKSTGAMNIIRDVSLRSMILVKDSDLQRRQNIVENFFQAIYGFRQEIGGFYGIVEFTGERNDVVLNYDFEALAANPAFINALSQIDFLSQFVSQFGERETEDLVELRDELARQLGVDSSAGTRPD